MCYLSVAIWAQGIGVAHSRFLWGIAHTYVLGLAFVEPSWLSGGWLRALALTRPPLAPFVDAGCRRCSGLQPPFANLRT